jgi:hypothetical protein
MGTRSLTYFHQDGKPFCAFYRQMDGYPSGHGSDLGEILAPITIVNGYQMGQVAGEFANGPGCLAAQVIAKLKNEQGLGGIYMVAPELDQDSWQEYEYHIHVNTVGDKKDWKTEYDSYIIVFSVYNPKTLIFSGPFKEFYEWTQNAKTDEDGNYVPVIVRKPAKASKSYTTLRHALQHEVVNVTFTKADGSTRDMECTTDMNRIPEDKHPTSGAVTKSEIDRHLYKVFDLEKNDWRAFRDERVIHWGVAS